MNETPAKRARTSEGPEGPIKLNVGGHSFICSRTTLCSQPGSMLAAMFDAESGFGRQCLDDEGRIFLDRDGRLFDHVLSFLRTGEFLLPAEYVEEVPQLKKPARAFSLPCSWRRSTLAFNGWSRQSSST